MNDSAHVDMALLNTRKEKASLLPVTHHQQTKAEIVKWLQRNQEQVLSA